GCLAKFIGDPERYLGGGHAAPAVPAAAAEWTCPMHPEIVRPAPGSCPICGMALETRTVTLEEAENPELADMRRRFWISAALTIPLVLMMLGAAVAPTQMNRL